MRKGVLLAEDTPENIMLRFEVNSIEDAFLILSQKQGDNDVIEAALAQLPSNQQHASNAICNGVEVIDASSIVQPTEKANMETNIVKPPLQGVVEENENQKKFFFTTKGRIKALMTKNFVQLFRQPRYVTKKKGMHSLQFILIFFFLINYSGIIFMLMFPLIQLSCFYMAIGKTPTNMRIGVVSSEISKWDTCFDPSLITVSVHNDSCNFNRISCRFVTSLEDSDYIKKVTLKITSQNLFSISNYLPYNF